MPVLPDFSLLLFGVLIRDPDPLGHVPGHPPGEFHLYLQGILFDDSEILRNENIIPDPPYVITNFDYGACS